MTGNNEERRIVFSKENISKIKEMRLNGISHKDIGKALGCGETRIRKECEKYSWNHQFRKEREANIINLVEDGLTDNEIARQLGIPCSSVTLVRKKAGKPRNTSEKKPSELQNRIIALRSNGEAYGEIANKLGTSKGYVRSVCRMYGCQYNDTERDQATHKNDEHWKQFIERKRPELEYTGNCTGSDGKANVRCRKCGCEFTVSMISVRHTEHNITCPNCHQRKRELKEQEKENIRYTKEKQRQVIKWNNAIQQQLGIKTCKECGEIYVGNSRCYCSDKCRRKAVNRNKDKRINRGNIVDKDITLQKLYKRDNGICYICGCTCDWNDYETINGAFVVGESYPTIEHVTPLAKGGQHSWKNIRLACWRCNTMKGTKNFTA